MQTTFKVKLYELFDDKGKTTYKILSPREARKIRSKKASKKLITAKLIGALNVRVSIDNLNI